MSKLAQSSFRNEARLYLLYVVAGVAAIPAGMVYAALAVTGWVRWWTVVPLLALGLASALSFWKYVEKRLLARAPVTVAIADAFNEEGSPVGLRIFAATASFAIFCAQPPHLVNTDQVQASEQGSAFVAFSNVS